jgi:hypothetical protein
MKVVRFSLENEVDILKEQIKALESNLYSVKEELKIKNGFVNEIK